MTQLVLLIGLPGSGKSTWAEPQVQQGWTWVSSDRVRQQLFGDAAIQGPWSAIGAELDNQLRAAVSVKAGTIYDATHCQRKQRRLALAHCRAAGFTSISGLWFDVPLGLCLSRNAQRDRQVPPAVIRTMARRLAGAPPQLADGFDRLWRWRHNQSMPEEMEDHRSFNRIPLGRLNPPAD